MALIAITLIASLPMFMSYLPYSGSHDLDFHLYRIEGIAQGLLSGEFPVRMSSSYLNGYGYPVGICYGDLFLYLPALLRCVGLSLAVSYRIFVIIVNAATSIATYYCFSRAFKHRSVGIVAAALWTLAPYRIVNLYLRASVGEYLSMTMYPIVFYGFYLMFFQETEPSVPTVKTRGWLWCALGMTGIILSHILSVMLVLIPLVTMAVIVMVIRRTARPLASVLAAIVTSALLSICFLVPFASFYSEVSMVVNTKDASLSRAACAINSVEPVQLFGFFESFSGICTDLLDGTVGDMPYSIGWGILLFGGLSVFVIASPEAVPKQSKESRWLLMALLVLAIVLMVMTTCLFPWDGNLPQPLSAIIGILARMQFPWRLLGPVSFLLICSGSLAPSIAGDSFVADGGKATKAALLAFLAVIALLSALEAAHYYSSMLDNFTRFNLDAEISADTGIGRNGVINGEYLPAGTDASAIVDDTTRLPTSETVEVSQYALGGSTRSMHVSASESGGAIALPMLYYPHYQVEFVDDASSSQGSGDGLTLAAGQNNTAVLTVPGGASGTVTISFQPPLLWRVCDGISLLTLVALVVAFHPRRHAPQT